MKRSSEATEHRHVAVESVAGQSFIDVDGDEETSVEGGFDAVGAIEGRPRNISLRDLRELMGHYRPRHRDCPLIDRDRAMLPWRTLDVEG
jgi:hypothetical protein